jgi:predicted transposase YdaD
LEEGREEGREEERRQSVQRRILDIRFGPLAAKVAKQVAEQVQALDASQLETALDIALTNPTLEAVLAQFIGSDPATN